MPQSHMASTKVCQSDSAFNGEELLMGFEHELAAILRGSSSSSLSLRASFSSSTFSSTSSCSSSSSSSDGSSPVSFGLRRAASEADGIEYESDGTLHCSRINYDVLCSLTGKTSLNELKSLSLCVKSHRTSTDNLSLLAFLTPNITTLKLDHSKFTTLRVLGDELPSLRTLSVCACGLKDLDGVLNASNLSTLVAANNKIDDLLPVTELRKITSLDLENNRVETYDSVSFLFLCPRLESLVLRGNPVAERPDYRETVFGHLPALQHLDIATEARIAKELCRRFRKDFNDDGSGGNAGSTDNKTTSEEGQLSSPEHEKDEEIPCFHEEASKDKFIQKLIQQEIPESPPDVPEQARQTYANDTEEKATPKATPLPIATFAISPAPLGNKKLLDRRRSLEPAKIESWVMNRTMSTKDSITVVPDGVDEGSDLGPLLQHQHHHHPGHSATRPDSQCSSVTFSENTDSGIDSSKASSISKEKVSQFPKLRIDKVETETGCGREPKRAKDLGLVRDNSNLSGALRKEDDIEIEDYDVEEDYR